MRSPKPHRLQPFLSLRDAAFRLGDRLVFEDTSWVFHRHEHWAIIGANGSGKSLLADALRGRLPLVRGELHYHFRPPPGLAPEEAISHVSFADRKADVHDTVLQSRWNSLEEEGALRVRDFLSYEQVMEVNPFEVTRRHDHARPRFEQRMCRAVALLQAAPLLDRRLMSLSNGERQRVQLVRALSHPMRLLILDEPFAGLDAATRARLHALLERFMDTPLRVLLITTRVEDLPCHITHLLHVAGCRVVAAGPRARVLSRSHVRQLFSAQVAGRRIPRTRSRPESMEQPLPRLRHPLPLRHLFSGARTLVRSNVGTERRQKGLPEQRSGWTFLRTKVRAPLNRYPLRGGEGAVSAAFGHMGRGPFVRHQSATPELVRLRHATVRYGDTVILRDVDWTIRAGESWALLGPNGSGKTTLLSLVLGDNPQVYTNDVTVFGRQRGEGESLWEIRKHIGCVSPELHVHFNDAATCFEVVASGFHDTIGLFQPPSARQRAAARRWLARFHLLEFAPRPLFSLSAGLQRMVLLARALVKNPRLLILDEPCQGLDAEHRNLFVRAVDALIRAGNVTVIYVTHRQDEIPPSISRFLRLRNLTASCR